MTTRRTVLAVAVLLLATGCGGGVGAGKPAEDGPRDWLLTVCGADAEIAPPPPDRDYDDYGAEDTLTCSTPGRPADSYYYVDAVAFRTGTDPAYQLSSAVDGWESGDGVELRYATRRLGDDTWAVVFSVAPTRGIKAGLDRLEGFDVSGSAELLGRSYD